MSEIAQRTGIIWTPYDDINLLAVAVDAEACMDEAKNMAAINQAARDWLDNKISLRDYCDILQLNDVHNPLELVHDFCEHTELIMRVGA
ncbi:hypothetical protein [Calothrix sp. NIES-2098]|uniref:hypothetical protein n=1 Tax=Calothrix sp. NIES-2098 TaxID=1954171 RepID=UPI000B61BEC5|nr:hypothetical protein NIES2098_38080 [Calothrix sp. NIES-2098]